MEDDGRTDRSGTADVGLGGWMIEAAELTLGGHFVYSGERDHAFRRIVIMDSE